MVQICTVNLFLIPNKSFKKLEIKTDHLGVMLDIDQLTLEKKYHQPKRSCNKAYELK